MNEDERRRGFAVAFIAQARSDWGVYRLLAERGDVAACHVLHYLQMACEKLAKAYRLRDTQSPVDDLLSKHTGFAKFVGPFFAAVLKDEYRGVFASDRSSQSPGFQRSFRPSTTMNGPLQASYKCSPRSTNPPVTTRHVIGCASRKEVNSETTTATAARRSCGGRLLKVESFSWTLSASCSGRQLVAASSWLVRSS